MDAGRSHSCWRPPRSLLLLCVLLIVTSSHAEQQVRQAGGQEETTRRLGAEGNSTVTPDCGDPYHSHWDWHNDQYSFVECMVLLPMILMAIVFEKIHKAMHHMVMHQTKVHIDDLDHGKKEIIHKGHVKGLYLIRLFERSSEEFMVLGFIAFCVWCLNKGSTFQKVVRPYDSYLRSGVGTPYTSYGPPAGGELLHLVEDVHMQLFIAMVFYFLLMVAAVHYVENSIALWNRYEKELKEKGYPEKCDGSITSIILRVLARRNISLFSYHSVRKYFIRWTLHNRKDCFKSENERQNEKELRQFARGFDFSLYLTVHLDEIMDEMLTIHAETWCFVAFFYAIMGVVARFAYEGRGDKIDPVHYGIGAVFFCIQIGILVCVQIFYRRSIDQGGDIDDLSANGLGKAASAKNFARASASAVNVKEGDDDAKLEEKSVAHNAEMLLLRALQAILLYSCFFCARFVGSPNVYALSLSKYTKIYGMAQWEKAVVVTCLILCTFCILPVLIGEINLMFRLPPFVDSAECSVVSVICKKMRDARTQPGKAGKSSNSHKSLVNAGPVDFPSIKEGETPLMSRGTEVPTTASRNKIHPAR